MSDRLRGRRVPSHASLSTDFLLLLSCLNVSIAFFVSTPQLRWVCQRVLQNQPPRTRVSAQLEPDFLSWLHAQGLKADNVAIADIPVPGGTYRGIASVRDIQPRETIVSLPASLALRQLRSDTCPAPEYEQFWESHKEWYVRLGLKLLIERGKGHASDCFHYLTTLPDVEDVKYFPVQWWDPSKVTFQYPEMDERVRKQQELWEALLLDFRRDCPSAPFTDDEMRWSWHMSLSRAFGGNFGGDLEAGTPAASLITDLAVLAGGFPSSDHILVPFLDMCNHDGQLDPSELVFNPVLRTLSLQAPEGGISAGNEVMITYGNLDNDELLLRFGFVEENCVHDTFVVSHEQLARALQLPGGSGQINSRINDMGVKDGCISNAFTLQCVGKEVHISVDTDCGTTSRGVASLGKPSKDALRQVCEMLLEEMTSSQDKEMDEDSEVCILVSKFRKAKTKVLKKTIMSLWKSEIFS